MKKQLQNRREFFKVTARKVLPVVGLLSIPNIQLFGGIANDMSCNNGCEGTCTGMCAIRCVGGCMDNCAITCQNTTKGMCDTCSHIQCTSLTVIFVNRLIFNAVCLEIIEDKIGLKKNSLFGTEVEQTQDSIESKNDTILKNITGCKTECYTTCYGGCKLSCMGPCAGTCGGKCIGSCQGTCNRQVDLM